MRPNPRMIIRDIIGEPLRYNSNLSGAEITERVKELLDLVGLNPRHLERYPHAFSGGQRQRIGIAGPWPPRPGSSCATKPFRPWTFPCRPR